MLCHQLAAILNTLRHFLLLLLVFLYVVLLSLLCNVHHLVLGWVAALTWMTPYSLREHHNK